MKTQACSMTDQSTAVQYAKAMKLKVIGLDIADAQLEDAERLGADAVFNTKNDTDYETKIKELTSGGCHAAAVFSASNAAYRDAPNTLRYVPSSTTSEYIHCVRFPRS